MAVAGHSANIKLYCKEAGALVRQKAVVAADVLEINNVEVIAARVKKDMLWVAVSVAVSVGIGLAVGSFF